MPVPPPPPVVEAMRQRALAKQAATRAVIPDHVMAQIAEKVALACEIGYAEVTLVIEKGRLRWIRGPAPSEAVRE